MLIGNGLLINKNTLSYIGGTVNGFSWNGDDEQLIVGDTKASIPEGYGDKAFRMPRKTGSLVGRDYFLFDVSNPTLLAGKNIDGDTSFEFAQDGTITKLVNMSGSTSISSTQDATLSKIVNISGDTSFEFTQTGTLVVPNVNLTGDMSFSFSQSGNLTVVKELSGEVDIEFASSGNMKVVRNFNGTTADTTGLTPASIWAYQDRTLTALDVEVSGLTVEQANQLTSIANNTGLIPALL